MESTVSMKSRGYSLRGRTAFSIYRFDNRDRSFVVMIFLCLTLWASAILLDQTEIYYNPEIIIIGYSHVFCILCGLRSAAAFAHGIADRRGDPLQEEEIKKCEHYCEG